MGPKKYRNNDGMKAQQDYPAADAQSEVGLWKCTVLYVEMSDVSHLVWVVFSPTLLEWFSLKNLFLLLLYMYIPTTVHVYSYFPTIS